MQRRIVVAILSAAIICGLGIQNVFAASSDVVISQVQLGTAASASNEFIELYNNSSTDTEVTNWCLYYASATSSAQGSRLGCIVPDNLRLHLYLPTHTYAYAISNQLLAAFPLLGSDLRFSATLSGIAGHVRIVNSVGSDVDKLGWGASALSPETSPSVVPPNGKILQRKTLSLGVLQDSDNNANDFELATARSSYAYGAIYEVQDICANIDGIQAALPTGYAVDTAGLCTPPPVDQCNNIDGLQAIVPTGYGLADDGTCQVDECINITGLQLVVPIGMDQSPAGQCVDHDECNNIAGIQSTAPAYYVARDGICLLNLAALRITELLPNVVGTDTGMEFIELYNPNDFSVDLGLYQISVGTESPKLYNFPTGSMIAAGQYATFFNDDIKFTLANTGGRVNVVTADGQAVDSSDAYTDAPEGESWELLDGTWQYTNQPTPGSANLPPLIITDDASLEVDTVKPCGPNQYRNPETNRCRLLITIASSLSPCKDGQYRSEETNRCRSIASEVGDLTQRAENQERNPVTNRCRSIAANTEVLGACKEGQERNPDTNRCRNVTAPTVPTAAFAVEPIADASGAVITWWAIGGIGMVALAYAGWEWRSEIKKASLKLSSFVRHDK